MERDDEGLAAAEDAVRAEWAERATAWRHWTPQWAAQTRAVTDLIVAAARVAPGMRVLDVASGTGEPALTLAAAVGPQGQVTATDLTAEMLAVAHDIARKQGVTNIAFQVTGAGALPFPDAQFDAITCRFGISHVPDYGRALREIRRVLKPSGRAAFAVWGPRAQNPHFTILDDAFAPYPAPPDPASSAPGPFTFAEPGTLSAALDQAGFRHVHEATHTVTLPWPSSVDDAWQGRCAMSGSSQRRLAALAPAERARVTAAALDALRVYDDGSQVALPGVVVVATGMR